MLATRYHFQAMLAAERRGLLHDASDDGIDDSCRYFKEASGSRPSHRLLRRHSFSARLQPNVALEERRRRVVPADEAQLILMGVCGAAGICEVYSDAASAR